MELASARRVARSAELGAQTKQQLVHAFAALACARGVFTDNAAFTEGGAPRRAAHGPGARGGVGLRGPAPRPGVGG